jgi:Tol biopolymer transport system component
MTKLAPHLLLDGVGDKPLNCNLALFNLSKGAGLPSGLKWYTIETEHFSVHFSSKPQEREQGDLANQIAWICEDVHDKLVPYMRWQPKQKTNIVIGDMYDYVSGWASPLPNNTIFICPTFPKEMTVNYKDWLENLIIHEYTHILHMDMASGLSGFLRKIFGRIILPNAIMPTMFHEGFTIFNETKIGGLGRCNSSYYNMMIRSAVLDNKFFPIDKCVTYELAQFPSGEASYLYGGMFYQYLAERFSPSKLVDYAHWYSGGIPLFYNVQAKRVFKKSMLQLWKDWKKESFNKYQAQINDVKQIPITSTKQLTYEGYYVDAPVFSNDGQKIFYISRNNHEYPALKEYDIIDKTTRIIIQKIVSSPLSISSDNSKLIFSIRDWYKNLYIFDDIYIYDLTEHKLKRITNGQRATDPDFSPVDNKIVFIGSELGQTNLFITDSDGTYIKQISFSDDFTQYAQPRFSPDGKKLVVAKWSVGGYQDLYLYDLETEWWTPITHTKALDIQPTWTKDGNFIFYSSDISGVFNIYAYGLKDKKTYQVTNVLTGAFAPAISTSNKQLVFLLYSSKGYDLHITDINLDSIISQPSVIASDSEVKDPEFNSGQVSFIEEQTYSDSIKTTLYHYNPFPSVLPKFWLPSVYYDGNWSIGAITYGADALFMHQYFIQGYYNLSSKKPSIFTNWTIEKFKSTIDINGYYDQGEFGGDVVNTFSFIKNDFVQYLSQSYSFDKTDYLLSGIGFSYQFGNAKSYMYSISPEQGIGFGFYCQRFDKLIASDYNLTKISFGADKYINLPDNHHILMVNVKGGLSFGDSLVDYQYTLKVRGKNNSHKVPNIVGATCEYRFPIFWIERGIGLFPLFFKNVSGSIFFDWAKPLSANRHPPTAIMSVGTEIHINSLVFYEIPVKFTLGIGSDLKNFSEPQIYLELSPQIPFLSDRKILKDAF